jgi:ectoine utilization protein EutC
LTSFHSQRSEAPAVNVTLLNETEIRGCAGFDQDALAAVGTGFSRLAEGKAYVPPVICIDVPAFHGAVHIKTAYIEDVPSFALKVASGFEDNRAKGLPYGTGTMVLISAQTGILEALLVDNGYLTDLRTGLAGGLAARHLAPRAVTTAGVIGAGVQARCQMRGLRLVRDFERIIVYSIAAAEIPAYVAEMSAELDVDVVAAPDVETVVRESQVVVTTTPATEPYLKAEWLHPGLHITCMGSDMPGKQELFAPCFARADIVACDSLSQCIDHGELHFAVAEGVLSDQSDIVELGELTSGRRPGRVADDQITICDLTGVGVQDTAIARFAYERAIARGLGTTYEN